jgi:hypothetical protein
MTGRFLRLLCCLAVGCAFALPAAGESWGSQNPPLVQADDVIRVLATFFPKVEARIVSVEDGGTRVEIDKGEQSGIYPGLCMDVVRSGEPFRDAYTDMVLGYRETRVGEVTVTDVGSQTATGRFRPDKDGSAMAGDRVRVSGAPLAVALLPASNYTDVRVLAHLSRKIDESSRFRAVDPFRVEATMHSLGLGTKRDPHSLVRIARLLKVNALIVADTTLVGSRVLLDLNAVSGASGESLAKVSGMLSGVSPLAVAASEAPAVSGIIAPNLPALSKPDAVVRVPFIPRFISPGDFRGNKDPLMALSDGRRVLVSEDSMKSFSTRFSENDQSFQGNRHVFLSVGSVLPTDPKSGREQIAVTNIVSGAPESYVLDYDGTNLRRVWKKAPLYLRIVKIPGRGPTLLGQKMGVNKPFLGNIHVYEWDRDHFQKGAAIDWPPGVSLFGTQPIELDGRTIFLQVGTDDHLEILSSRGDLQYKSPIFLGGYFDHFVYGRPHELLPVSQRNVHLKGRILTLSSGGKGGGKPVIVVYKNVPFSTEGEQFQGYQYGQVFFYQWTGLNWVLKEKLTRVKGFITDIALGTNPQTLKPSLIIATEPVFNFMNIQNLFVNEGTLSFYSLPASILKDLTPKGATPTLFNRPSGGSPR